MGAVAPISVQLIGSVVLGAVTIGAWCVFGTLVVVAGTGVVLVVIAGVVLLLADAITDAVVGLVRGVLASSGAVMGDVLDPAVHA